MRAPVVAWALALALLAGGCMGGESDEDRIRSVVDDWGDALVQGDGERACELMSAGGKDELETMIRTFSTVPAGASGCAEVAATFRDGGEEAEARIEVREVEVRGDTARAAAEGEGPPEIELLREGEHWRISAFLEGGWPGLGIPRAPGG